jgi:hypothetical protein
MDLLMLYDERPIQRGEKPFAVRAKERDGYRKLCGIAHRE